MFKKYPEKYRGPICWILSAVTIVLILVQCYFTTLPCMEIEDVKKDTTGVYSMTDIMWTKTDIITDLLYNKQKEETGVWKFNINPYADMPAFAFALGLATVVMSLISLKCFATHIISVFYACFAIWAWNTSKIWDLCTLPVTETIRTVMDVTLYACAALIAIRTIIYLVYRFAIPFVKWRKATNEWKVIYKEALANEAAEKAAQEAAAN